MDITTTNITITTIQKISDLKKTFFNESKAQNICNKFKEKIPKKQLSLPS